MCAPMEAYQLLESAQGLVNETHMVQSFHMVRINGQHRLIAGQRFCKRQALSVQDFQTVQSCIYGVRYGQQEHSSTGKAACLLLRVPAGMLVLNDCAQRRQACHISAHGIVHSRCKPRVEACPSNGGVSGFQN